MSVTLQPLLNHVTLRLEPEPEKSKIIAVQSAYESLARFGVVEAVGPEVRDVKVGMRVLASVTAGVQLDDGLTMIPEDSVLAFQHE